MSISNKALVISIVALVFAIVISGIVRSDSLQEAVLDGYRLSAEFSNGTYTYTLFCHEQSMPKDVSHIAIEMNCLEGIVSVQTQGWIHEFGKDPITGINGLKLETTDNPILPLVFTLTGLEDSLVTRVGLKAGRYLYFGDTIVPDYGCVPTAIVISELKENKPWWAFFVFWRK